MEALLGGRPFDLDVDRIVVATGFRPDLSFLRELRIELDPAVEAPPKLAPLIDPNFHSCGTVPPHGIAELAHPEPGFVIVGSKSYGRAPTFLMATGYEQVRSVVAELAGDHAAARKFELVLPGNRRLRRGLPIDSESPPDCCGGPAPASIGACCVADAKAKDAARPVAAAACRRRGNAEELEVAAMTSRHAVRPPAIWALGATQIIGYGTLYYSYSILAPGVAAELGLSLQWVFAILSASLLASAILAPVAGRWADRCRRRAADGAGLARCGRSAALVRAGAGAARLCALACWRWNLRPASCCTARHSSPSCSSAAAAPSAASPISP